VQLFRLIAVVLAASAVHGAVAIYPLKDVRAGQLGVGRTVFSGTKVEEFQVEILGVLENIGPRESIILARLKGGPLENTGVMQGMSGSPVYIDGRLVGAVALGFPLAKEPIAGIRPIEEMLRVDPDKLAATAPPRRRVKAGNAQLEEIATPVSFSGFTAATLDHFGARLRDLGLDPRQGVSGGGKPADRLGDPSRIEPGSMISVQLLSGDMSVGADGTVTCIDGNRLYAFGHRFLAAGSTELPFARSEVLALLPNLSASFKIATAREWMGSITEDRNTAVSGLMGKRATLVPLDIKVGTNSYHMNMIQDRVITPLVTQMAVFSSIDATERSVGPSTYSVRGKIDFEGGSVKLNNVYSGDISVSAMAAVGVSTPLGFALSSGFDALKLKNVGLEIGVVDRRSQLQVSEVVTPRQVRPGDNVEVMVTLAGENGIETTKKVNYRVPVGAPPGVLFVSAADATYTNMLDFQAAVGTPQHSPSQVLGLLNSLRGNTKAYLRVWRADGAYTVDGRDLPNPPPSVALILNRAQGTGAGLLSWRGSKLAEIEIPAGEFIVTGFKTTQFEVKE
jgi:SpoIVB peptidase S55